MVKRLTKPVNRIFSNGIKGIYMAESTPCWLSRAVFYEVFVRNHGAGGFDAVRADLDRIQGLGADVVWLMPIHPIGVKNRNGTVGSPYAIRDYAAINPELGDEASFQALVEAVHARGLKIILDVVFNHTSPDSLLAESHPEWFLKNAQGQPMPKFPEWADIVDLRYVSPEGTPHAELWALQIETLGKWIDRGVDGFRCDVASVVPPAFWAEAKHALARRAGPQREVVWLAETVHKHFLKFMRDRGYPAWSDSEVLRVFDLSYDHDGAEYLDEYFAGKRTLGAYLDHLLVQETMNPLGSHKLRFVENHDQPRAADKVRGDERLRCWTAFQALLPGAFLVYAGQEFRARHRPDLFVPDPVALPPPGVPEDSFSGYLRNLIAVMKTLKAECRFFEAKELASGVVELVWRNRISSPTDERLAPGEVRYTAVLNLEDRFGTVKLVRPLAGPNLLGGPPVALVTGGPLPKEPVLVVDRG